MIFVYIMLPTIKIPFSFNECITKEDTMNIKMLKMALVGLIISMSGLANAGLILNLDELNGDVVISWNGSLDLGSAVFDATRNSNSSNLWTAGGVGDLQSMFASGSVDDYDLAAFTKTPTLAAFTGSLSGGIIAGDNLFIDFSSSFRQIWMPNGYQSGQVISGSGTFAGATFASLGANVGTYEWAWSNNIASDSLTLIVGSPTNVPEPSSLAIFALGIMGLASRRLKKQ